MPDPLVSSHSSAALDPATRLVGWSSGQMLRYLSLRQICRARLLCRMIGVPA